MNEHELAINNIKNSIYKFDKKAELYSNFIYNIKKKGRCEIDLLIYSKNNLFVFEIKSGTKEEKARKQLKFHKIQLVNLKYNLAMKYRFQFENIKFFWIPLKYNLIVNIDNNEQIAFNPTFLENPLLFLLK